MPGVDLSVHFFYRSNFGLIWGFSGSFRTVTEPNNSWFIPLAGILVLLKFHLPSSFFLSLLSPFLLSSWKKSGHNLSCAVIIYLPFNRRATPEFHKSDKNRPGLEKSNPLKRKDELIPIWALIPKRQLVRTCEKDQVFCFMDPHSHRFWKDFLVCPSLYHSDSIGRCQNVEENVTRVFSPLKICRFICSLRFLIVSASFEIVSPIPEIDWEERHHRGADGREGELKKAAW